MSEGRYDEGQVREILRRAAEAELVGADMSTRDGPWPRSRPTPVAGFTLDDLQRIGADAQLSPDAIAAAARAVDLEASWQVERRVEPTALRLAAQLPLPSDLDEVAWGRIAAVLREVYGEVGVITEEGAMRRWRTGTLDQPGTTQVLLEPDPSGPGWRLALRVAAEDHTQVLSGVFLGLGALAAAVPPLLGASLGWLGLGAAISACGAMMWAAHRAWRPRWEARARTRFDTALARLAALTRTTTSASALPDAAQRT